MCDPELTGIIEDLEGGYKGDPWHGPSLLQLLDGVTAVTVADRPIPGAHSIWEIVLYLAAWTGVVARRIDERIAIESPLEGDFPAVVHHDAGAWEGDLKWLEAQQDRLLRTVRALDPFRLREPVAGKNYSVGHMLRGVPQHIAYHVGQIALIRRVAVIK